MTDKKQTPGEGTEELNEEVLQEEVQEDVKQERDAPAEEEEAKPGETETPEEKPDVEKELNDKYLRLVAEFDNYKKRTAKEKPQAYTNAAADVIEAILPFVDNLARATTTEVTSEDGVKLLEGVKLIQRQFEETLKKLGVEEIKAVRGTASNPNLHNAVMHVEDDTVGTGTELVVEEFMKGYMYKDKVIRHSTVESCGGLNSRKRMERNVIDHGKDNWN